VAGHGRFSAGPPEVFRKRAAGALHRQHGIFTQILHGLMPPIWVSSELHEPWTRRRHREHRDSPNQRMSTVHSSDGYELGLQRRKCVFNLDPDGPESADESYAACARW